MWANVTANSIENYSSKIYGRSEKKVGRFLFAVVPAIRRKMKNINFENENKFIGVFVRFFFFVQNGGAAC